MISFRTPLCIGLTTHSSAFSRSVSTTLTSSRQPCMPNADRMNVCLIKMTGSMSGQPTSGYNAPTQVIDKRDSSHWTAILNLSTLLIGKADVERLLTKATASIHKQNKKKTADKLQFSWSLSTA